MHAFIPQLPLSLEPKSQNVYLKKVYLITFVEMETVN